MPLPLAEILLRAAASVAKKQFIKALGRTVYRDARGRMISFNTYKNLRSSARTRELALRKTFGRPPSGWSWVRIANKYHDRFEGYGGQ